MRDPPDASPRRSWQHAYCVVAGRSSGLRTCQPWAEFLTPCFPIVFKDSISAELRAFVFAYRCGAAPDSHRVPY